MYGQNIGISTPPLGSGYPATSTGDVGSVGSSNLAPLRLKPEEVELFSRIFSALDTSRVGTVSGSQVSKVFTTSGLDKAVLAEVGKKRSSFSHFLDLENRFPWTCIIVITRGFLRCMSARKSISKWISRELICFAAVHGCSSG